MKFIEKNGDTSIVLGSDYHMPKQNKNLKVGKGRGGENLSEDL